MMLSPSLDTNFLAGTERNTDIIELIVQKTKFLSSLRHGCVPKILDLLVALSGMLSQDHFRQIAPILWHQCLDNRGSQALASVSFGALMCI
jgi:hypothetical protein